MVVWLCAPSIRAPARVGACITLAAAVLIAIVAGGLVPSPTERLAEVTAAPSVTQPNAGSGQARLEEASTAWSRIVANPLVGAGFDRAGAEVNIVYRGQLSGVQTHGAPIAALYEGGVLALIGLTVIVGGLAMTGWRALSAAELVGADSIIGWAMLAAFAAWVVDFLSNPLYFQEWGWLSGAMLFVWAFVVAAPALRRRVAPAAPVAAM